MVVAGRGRRPQELTECAMQRLVFCWAVKKQQKYIAAFFQFYVYITRSIYKETYLTIMATL